MQPIVYLAIVGVAVGGLGIGFLNNDISLSGMVQQFGVGETTIISPADGAYIDFKIEATKGQLAAGPQGKVDVFKNIITACLIQADSGLVKATTIICKLTDIDSNVVIEGKKVLTTYLKTKVPTFVSIIDTSPGTPENLVSNIHDVQLVIVGPSALVTVPTTTEVVP